MKSLAIVMAAIVGIMPPLAHAQDIGAGEQAFKRCTACHSVGENAANRMGPQLNGVVGKEAATQEGFNYSQALRERGEAGLTWTPETLTQFIHSPRDYVPGNKMSFAGVKDDKQIADIIAYLMTFSPDFVPAAPAESGAAASQ
jgi:cytochrome c2